MYTIYIYIYICKYIIYVYIYLYNLYIYIYIYVLTIYTHFMCAFCYDEQPLKILEQS